MLTKYLKGFGQNSKNETQNSLRKKLSLNLIVNKKQLEEDPE